MRDGYWDIVAGLVQGDLGYLHSMLVSFEGHSLFHIDHRASVSSVSLTKGMSL